MKPRAASNKGFRRWPSTVSWTAGLRALTIEEHGWCGSALVATGQLRSSAAVDRPNRRWRVTRIRRSSGA